jgi:hypothetical protein
MKRYEDTLEQASVGKMSLDDASTWAKGVEPFFIILWQKIAFDEAEAIKHFLHCNLCRAEIS